MSEKHIINVRLCRRVGGKDCILVCECCGNEVEHDGNACWVGNEQTIHPFKPRGNFCMWCGAPLKSKEDK